MNNPQSFTAGNKLHPLALLPLLAVLLFALGACAGMGSDDVSSLPDPVDEEIFGSSGNVTSDAASSIPGSKADLEVNVGDRVFFDTDSTELNGQSQATLQRQAAWMQRYPNIQVRIEGHADERGTREYNLGLSQRRANMVREYLIGLGVVPNRLSIIPYGKERPLALCSNENCWKQNRRAVTTVVGPGS